MGFASFIKTFGRSEDGAVTIDWVLLTASVAGLAVAAMATVSDGTGDVSGAIRRQLEDLSMSADDPSGPPPPDIAG
ncbi:pilus assembly protein [Oceaniglobus roseus]|uniref:pilus assembly protein n=1 Tax=Oceaniglobus roseus TaxID=1737570 RepID=UPI000C7F52CE|nr:pilus assembly protein [Kandeliimicrobium roseum]